MTMDVYPLKTPNTSFYLDVARGDVPGHSVVHKFGHNDSVGTTFAPVSMGAIYRTPQVAAATTLRVKAGNTNDTAAGSGAREITLEGPDETGATVTESLATAGVSASAATTTTFIRMPRAWVSASGTYATTTTGSHEADIVIENGAGGTDWLTIDAISFPRGQSEVSCFPVPLGKEAYIISIEISVDAAKSADIMLMKREDMLQSAPPYTAMREVKQWTGVSGHIDALPKAPLGSFPALTDLIFFAKAASPSAVVIEFEILLIDT